MKKVIIPQKQVGTGFISDVQSDSFDREVEFKNGAKFAFIKAAHYQDDNHKMFAELIDAQMFAADSNFTGEIIEDDGSRYTANTGYIGSF